MRVTAVLLVFAALACACSSDKSAPHSAQTASPAQAQQSAAAPAEPGAAATPAQDPASPNAPMPAATMNSTAATTPNTPPSSAIVEPLALEVAQIDERLKSGRATRTDRLLDPTAFAQISETPWANLSTDSEQGELLRATLSAALPDTSSQDFYFLRGSLILVTRRSAAGDGERYWFDAGNMLAMTRAGGTQVNPTHPDFASNNTRLLAEARLLRELLEGG